MLNVLNLSGKEKPDANTNYLELEEFLSWSAGHADYIRATIAKVRTGEMYFGSLAFEHVFVYYPVLETLIHIKDLCLWGHNCQQ